MRGVTPKALGLLVASLLLLPVVVAQDIGTPQGTPSALPGAPIPDPDIPPLTEPVATLTPFVEERFSFTEGTRTRTVTIPDIDYDRAIVTFHSYPDKEPWDRLFAVGIGQIDVLHGATPRGEFTLEKDITRFADQMRPGTNTTVQLYLSSWIGGAAIIASVTIDLYVDEPTASLVDPAADEAIPIHFMRWFRADRTTHHKTVNLANETPSAAELRVTLSGHGSEEFWYLSNPAPRTFTIQADGTTIGTIKTYPWVYALLGFDGSSTAYTINQLLWWSWQPAADKAGIHWGDGEIPAYRIQIAEEHLPLLTGETDITIRGTGSNNHGWSTSVSLLLDR